VNACRCLPMYWRSLLPLWLATPKMVANSRSIRNTGNHLTKLHSSISLKMITLNRGTGYIFPKHQFMLFSYPVIQIPSLCPMFLYLSKSDFLALICFLSSYSRLFISSAICLFHILCFPFHSLVLYSPLDISCT
jgi:hypothetical protein